VAAGVGVAEVAGDLVDELRQELLRSGGVVPGVVEGRSMVPFLQPGDRVLAGPPDEVRPGDLVVFRRDGRWIVHRVLEARGDLLLEGGDRVGPTGLLPADQVIGRVVAVRRGGRELKLGSPVVRSTKRLLAWLTLVHAAARPGVGTGRRFRPVPRVVARAVISLLGRAAWALGAHGTGR